MKLSSREDFDKLHRLPFNRPTKFRADLAVKMCTFGFQGAVVLIKTDLFDGVERIYPADGEHRILTGKELGITVDAMLTHYKFKSIVEIVMFVAALNHTQKEWKAEDYINAYEYLDYKDYQLLVMLKKSCAFTYPALAIMLHGFRSKGSVSKHIKEGTFKCNFYKETKNTLRLANKLSVVGGALSSRMAIALHGVSNLPEFNEEKFQKIFAENYEKIKELNLDNYTDTFTSWVKG